MLPKSVCPSAQDPVRVRGNSWASASRSWVSTSSYTARNNACLLSEVVIQGALGDVSRLGDVVKPVRS